MFTARAESRRPSGFTLLEIVLAVAILAMMSLAIYRFVASNMTALRISAESNLVDEQYAGFSSLLASEWTSLPAGAGALVGEPFKLNNRSRDEITWICSAGPGLLTRYATGEYRVSLRLRSMSGKGDRMEIGVMRQALEEGGSAGEGNWIPLLPNVQSLKISYFDPRLNVWVEKWTDTISLPRLVRLAIGRVDNSAPWEAIIPLARTPL